MDQQPLASDEQPHQEYQSYPLRPYNPETDSGIVIGAWRDHIRSLAPFKYLDREALGRHDGVLEGLVERCRPIVVCGSEIDAQVKGWICCEHQGDVPVLHFLYVRNTWRQRGIATALMGIYFAQEFKRRTIYHTHPGRSVKHLRAPWKLVHNPYLVN
jgi:GNAT superfamily N-acetyltransferase